MKKPTQLRSNGLVYTISEDRTQAHNFEFNGLCIPTSTSIIMNPDQSDERYRVSLLHELLHTAWITAPKAATQTDPYDNEELIEFTAHWLKALLEDNWQELDDLLSYDDCDCNSIISVDLDATLAKCVEQQQ
jgi:hypothetical protein